MERLTFDRDFCDVSACLKTRGGSFCEDGTCYQRNVWERLKEYENTGLTPEEIEDLASVREISPEAEYAVNKFAGSIIERLDALLQKTDDDAHTREQADVVPVVRCRDCKHYYQRQVPHPYACCILHTGLVLTNDETYCSYGERKGGASDESP